MQLDQKALIEEAVQASIDAGLAVNGEHGVAAARHAARFMFNTLQAVQPVPVVAEDAHQFKNFHRLLCERFGYCHDEKDWRRDQVSLIEHIAALTAAVSAEPVITDELRGKIAYQLTKRLVIDMPTARACVDDALKGFVHAAPLPAQRDKADE